MPKFRFKAKDLNNKIINGIFFAKDEDDLREIINNLDYFLISSKKIQESSQMFSFLEKIKVEELALFCRQLAIMIDAGMELVKCIEVLKNNVSSLKLKGILEVVHFDLMQGKMMSESLAKYPKTFPLFFRNMIHIGEISGKMPSVLNRLADYYEKDNKIKHKVKSAISYPIFLIFLCFAIVAVLALYVMPIFKDVFESLNAELPKITLVVLAVTDFLKQYFLFIIIGMAAVVGVFFLLLRLKSFRKMYDKFAITYSFMKNAHIATITSRFTNGFATLLGSSISIVDALTIMSKLLGNTYVEERMQVTISEIKRGQPIAKSLATINIFPSILIEMIAVGEESGQLEEVLNRVCGYFDDQVDYTIKKMTGMIEPLMIIMIGGIVVIVLLSIFIPMLNITNSIDPGV